VTPSEFDTSFGKSVSTDNTNEGPTLRLACVGRVAALIPAYNEERFIGSVVIRTLRYVDDVIVVDDGSSDLTALIADAAGAIVIQHPHNMGKGAALQTGFLRARHMDAAVLVMLDGDGQHLPEELTQVIRPIVDGQADIVIGSRYLDNVSNVPRHRVLGHNVFNLITRVTTGTNATDSQSGYRAFSSRALELLSFNSNSFSVESEMQFMVREHDLRLAEVPITIEYNEKPKRPVIQHGLIVLNGILSLVGQYRPLLFFGVVGLLLMTIGLGWGMYVVDILERTGNLAIGSALLSAIFAIMGMISFSTGIILHSVRALLISFAGARLPGSVYVDI
jgi:glycosyltransferase involved in cell wall biosynthesis